MTDHKLVLKKGATIKPGDTISVSEEPAPPPPPPPPPPTGGIPAIPAGRGTILKKNFADGTLSPFRVLTIPNDHIGGSGQYMSVWCRYGSKGVKVANGVLRLECTRQASGSLWDASFVGTSDDGHGGASTFHFQYGRILFPFRMNVGQATWQTPIWLIAWVNNSWGGDEIDWPEVISGQLQVNLHGSMSGGTGFTPPADLATVFHLGEIVKAPNYVAVSLDGKEVWRKSGSMPEEVAIVGDSKVGLAVPSAATPSPTWAEVPWITVDPV